ncbi:MAG: MFS transporter [Anaerolineae bacterium]|nr:MFS transporter [Anaerolineae bacterium]
MLKRLPSLQHRDFRLLWLAQFASFVGSQMQLTAVNWDIFTLLRGQVIVWQVFGAPVMLAADAFGLGLLGLARVLPIIAFALVGGALADARDRRSLMMWSSGVSILFSGALAALALFGNAEVWPIYLATAGITAAAAFGNPARQALLPNIVPREHFTNAVSLNTLGMQIASIVGPAVAGLLIGATNIGVIYALNALSFLCVIVALLMMTYRDDARRAGDGAVSLRAIGEGLRFVFSSPMIASTMLLDFFATFFSSARTMLPIIAAEIVRTDAAGYGLLSTAQALGSVVAGVITSLRREIQHQGKVLIASVLVFGAATALFGLTTNFALSYFFFALTGAADTVSTVVRNIIRQMHTPDALRGRMVGVNMIFFIGGPQLGELEAGLVAAAFGVPFSVVSGGVITVLLTLWVAARFPMLRNYRAISQPVGA